MKILHVIHAAAPEATGGSQSYLADLVAAQRAAGHDVAQLTGSFELWPAAGLEKTELGGVPTWRVHRDDFYFDHHAKAWHPGVAAAIEQALDEAAPDVVHVHHWVMLTSEIVALAEARGIATVVTLHDLYTTCPRCYRVRPDGEACDRPLSVESCLSCVPRYGHEPDEEIAEGIRLYAETTAAELGRARAVVVAAGVTADVVAANTGLARERFTVLPLAYRPRFTEAREAGYTPATPHAADTPLRFGYWGSVDRRKGVGMLLEATRILVEAGLGDRFTVDVFGQAAPQEFVDEIARLVDGAPVTLHGRFETPAIPAAGLHVAVFPTLCFETFGLVLDEAVELGLPAIVTDIGALPERGGAAVLRVPPHDAAALAAAMRGLIEDPARVAALRAHLPALPPTPAEHAAAVEAVYRAAAAAAPVAGPPAPTLARRLAFLTRQRESAQAAAHPGRGPR